MKHRFKFIATLALAALALLVIAYPLYAHCGKCAADGKKIAAQLDQNKMTLAKAVTAAEQHSKGRAISVISELNDQDKLMMEVYCIVGDSTATSKIMMCQVDGATGNVKQSKEVKAFPITDDDHAHDETPKGTAFNITNRTVDAACGACVYKMSGVSGCPLAVKIDGQAYLVQGAQWPNHDYCDRNCQAVVTGRIEGDKFIATSLQPKN